MVPIPRKLYSAYYGLTVYRLVDPMWLNFILRAHLSLRGAQIFSIRRFSYYLRYSRTAVDFSMPTDDYSVAISGGLKLKGVNDSSKVSKPQKKKRSKLASTNTKFEGSKDEAPEFSKEADVEEYAHDGDLNVNLNRRKMDDVEKDALSRPQVGRTEAELKHEERKRKRVCLPVLPSYCDLILCSSHLCYSSTNALSVKGLRLTRSASRSSIDILAT